MMPSCMAASQIRQPAFAAPTLASSGTRTFSSVTSYCVSEARLLSCFRDTPAVCGSTRNSETSSGFLPVRASTRSREAIDANVTCRFWPESVQPLPDFLAWRFTPCGPKPLCGSSQAGVTIASPAASFGSHSSFCALVPAASSTPAAITADSNAGVGASARPSSSNTSTASSRVWAEPPYSSGTSTPSRPSSASCFQSASGTPFGSSSIARTTATGLYSAQSFRTVSRSTCCSSLQSRFTASLLRPPLVAAALPGVVVRRGRQRDARRALGRRLLTDGEPDREADPAAADRVLLHLLHLAVEDHAVAREDGVLHAELDLAEPALRARPVGDEALEEGRIVRGVDEDVPQAVAVDGEVLVVVHGAVVARGDRARHHGRGGHVDGELGQALAHLHLVESEGLPAHCALR